MAGENRFRITKKANAEKYDQLVDLAKEKLARRNKVMRMMSTNLVDSEK